MEKQNKGVFSQSFKPRVFKFSEFQVEAAKYKAMGYSLSQIAKMLKEQFKLEKEPSISQIHQSLKAFESVSKRMRQAVLELSKAGFWEKQIDHRPLSLRALEREKQMLLEGYWPFKLVPYGYYKDDEGKIKIDIEKAENIRKLFELAAKGGEGLLEFGQKVMPGSPSKIYRLLGRHIYKGYQPFSNELLHLPHLAIIDEKTWREAQKIHVGRRGPPPFGYRWIGLRLVPVPEEREIVQKIFILRLENKSLTEIAEKLKLQKGLPQKIIKRQLYKTRKWRVSGRTVEVEGDAFVPAVVWDRAQYIKLNKSYYAEKRRKQIQNEIINYLKKWHFATASQIARDIKKGFGAVNVVLDTMKFNGLVNRKRSGRYWLWFLVENPDKEKAEIWGELVTKSKPGNLKKIIEQLPAKTSEIQKKTGIRKVGTISEWLKRLKQKGIVEKHPPHKFGMWYLTQEWAKFFGKNSCTVLETSSLNSN